MTVDLSKYWTKLEESSGKHPLWVNTRAFSYNSHDGHNKVPEGVIRTEKEATQLESNRPEEPEEEVKK